MKIKSMMWVSITAAALLMSTLAYAGGCKKCGDKGYGKDSMEDKFFKKIHFIMENEKELDITAEQKSKIKKLKYDTKKMIIRADADKKIVYMDIKAGMYEDEVDLPSVLNMVDKKYEIKKEKAKGLVTACVELKNILSQDQKEEMKELWKACKKEQYGKCEKGECKHKDH